jgi:hypothetical protein
MYILALFLFLLLLGVFIVLPIILVIRVAARLTRRPVHVESSPTNVKLSKQADAAEVSVDTALRQLHESRYFVFRDLIIPSSSQSMSLTQIDHVVVSRVGIFCIETKSNKGHIYGFRRNEYWKQYLGNSGKPFMVHSPYRQNKHHVSSLELLLSDTLKAPIHSYIAFPNAQKVVVDGKVEDMTPKGVVAKINQHTHTIYAPEDIERIAKIVAHAGTFREQLREKHAYEVKAFIDAKVAGTLKLS